MSVMVVDREGESKGCPILLKGGHNPSEFLNFHIQLIGAFHELSDSQAGQHTVLQFSVSR